MKTTKRKRDERQRIVLNDASRINIAGLGHLIGMEASETKASIFEIEI